MPTLSEKQGSNSLKYYNVVCYNNQPRKSYHRHPDLWTKKAFVILNNAISGWIVWATEHIHRRKGHPKLKSSKSDVRTTLILDAWEHFTFRRWACTEEREGSRCSWCSEQPSLCVWVRGCGVRGRWTGWHLSQCSRVASQCSPHFPETHVPANGRRAVGLGQWRRKEDRGKVSEKRVRERMSRVTTASAQVLCFFKCFSSTTKGRKQNQHHLLFLFVYPLLLLQSLTGKGWTLLKQARQFHLQEEGPAGD